MELAAVEYAGEDSGLDDELTIFRLRRNSIAKPAAGVRPHTKQEPDQIPKSHMPVVVAADSAHHGEAALQCVAVSTAAERVAKA